MELKEFTLDEERIEGAFPGLARAPPRKQFERYRPDPNEAVYAIADDDETTAGFDQTRPDTDASFDQAQDMDFNQDAG